MCSQFSRRHREAFQEAYGAIWCMVELIQLASAQLVHAEPHKDAAHNGKKRHLPIRIDAVLVNHGFQGVRISWRKKKGREREGD